MNIDEHDNLYDVMDFEQLLYEFKLPLSVIERIVGLVENSDLKSQVVGWFTSVLVLNRYNENVDMGDISIHHLMELRDIPQLHDILLASCPKLKEAMHLLDSIRNS